MSTRELSTERLDDLAARVIAGIEQEAEQTAAEPFFELIMAEVESKPATRRKYTGAEFFLREPLKFKAVVGYLAEGRGQLWIADRVGCSHHTVRAVKEHFPKSVAIEKERLADRCDAAATLMVDKIIEEPDKVPPQAWGLVAAQLIDKALLLRGGPSLTIEHRHTFSHGDFNALLAGAPAIDVPSETLPAIGYTAEESVPKGEAPAPPAPAAPPAADQALDQAPTDSASLDSQRTGPPATQPAPLSPADSRLGPGGEGVADRERGGASDEG